MPKKLTAMGMTRCSAGCTKTAMVKKSTVTNPERKKVMAASMIINETQQTDWRSGLKDRRKAWVAGSVCVLPEQLCGP